MGGPGSGRRRTLTDAQMIARGTWRRDRARDPANVRRVGGKWRPCPPGTAAEPEELSLRDRHRLERLMKDDDPW